MPEIVQVKDSSEECNKMENALEALNEVLKLKMKSVVQDLEIKQLKEDLAKLMQDINKLETALTWDF
ncbi:hypothetical protein TYRP_010776 [Tyrophagus putrescentiae]|nr:hypothetical protein TYRP_010776 [Tyrophagus putrescentiae]